MGLLAGRRRRTRTVTPDLEGLLALPTAALALRSATGLRPTGVGAVCVKPSAPGPFQGLPSHEQSTDSFGYTWLTCSRSPDNPGGLIADLHAINAALVAQGDGSGLLCTLLAFTDGHGPAVGLIYLPKRGTWYPFAPTGNEKRDNQRELRIKEQLGGDLKVDQDLSRWSPLWGAPGL